MVEDGSKNFVPRFWDLQQISSRYIFERNIQNDMGKGRYVEGILAERVSLKIFGFRICKSLTFLDEQFSKPPWSPNGGSYLCTFQISNVLCQFKMFRE